MAEYQYRIITPKGKEKRGTIEAKFPEQAKTILKAEGNIVLSIEEAGILSKEITFSFGTGIKPRDYSIFCRQFVSVIRAGVSVVAALEMLGAQTENKALKKGIIGTCEDVSKGEPLAVAMRKRVKVFPTMLCNMVEAGEASGNLETAFTRMAIQFEKEDKLKSAARKAMIYPIILIVVMLVVLAIMLAYVIPNFQFMFAELGTELPVITKVVISMSNFFVKYWGLLLLVCVAVILAYRFYVSTADGKLWMDRIKLKLPIFGKLQSKTACAEAARTFHTLLAAGVPMIEAIDITARSMDNLLYRRALLNAKEQVQRGVALSKPLQMCDLFPPMVIHMIAIGEETGNMESMLESLADYYEDDVQNATEQMMAFMEPMLIIVMAGVIGIMVISVLQPMFALYNSIG